MMQSGFNEQFENYYTGSGAYTGSGEEVGFQSVLCQCVCVCVCVCVIDKCNNFFSLATIALRCTLYL